MADAKTRPAPIDLARHLAALPDPAQRRDCATLATLMQRVSGAPPVLWGSKIVGFGTYRYQYASGRGGDWPLIGFAPRGRELTVYMMDGLAQRAAQLAALGPHKTGKSCLYLKGLDGLDLHVLEAMLAESVRAMRARYPAGEAITPATAANPASKAAARKTAAKKTSAKKAPVKKSGLPAEITSATKSPIKVPTRKLSKNANGKALRSSARSVSAVAREAVPAARRKTTSSEVAGSASKKPAARAAASRARKSPAQGTAGRAR